MSYGIWIRLSGKWRQSEHLYDEEVARHSAESHALMPFIEGVQLTIHSHDGKPFRTEIIK